MKWQENQKSEIRNQKFANETINRLVHETRFAIEHDVNTTVNERKPNRLEIVFTLRNYWKKNERESD